MMNLPTCAFLHQTCVSQTVLSDIYGMQSLLLTTFLGDPGFCMLSLYAFRLGGPQFFWYEKSIGISEYPNKHQILFYNPTNKRILNKCLPSSKVRITSHL